MKTTLSLLCLLSASSLLAQTADLSITQSTDVTRATVGQNMVYTLSAHNAGPDANPSVRVTDYLPAEVSVVNMDAACQADVNDSRLLNCDIGLNSGATQNLSIEVHVDSLPAAGPRVYMSGLLDDGIATGLFRYWTDTQEFDVISAAPDFFVSPRGVYLLNDGGVLIANRGDLTVLNPNPISDGKIQYEHPFQSELSFEISGGLLVNPNDVIKAPDGMWYVADANGVRLDGMGQPTADTTGRIIKINPNTAVQTLVAEGTNISTPTGLIWRAGQLIVSDLSGKIISIDPTTGTQQLILSGGLLQTPQALTEVNGVYYVADSTAGIVSINALSLAQSIFAPSDTNGGVLSAVVDIDHFNNQELYVLNGSVLNGSNKIISRFTLSTGAQLSDIDMSFGLNEVNGIDVDNGESFLENNIDISSLGSVLDENYINDIDAIYTPVDMQTTQQILVIENITVTDAATLTPAQMIKVIENIMVADNITLTPAQMIKVIETIAVSDNVTLTPAQMIKVIETISVSDAVTLTPAQMIKVIETILVTDTPNIVLIQPPRIVKVRPISGLCHNQITSGDELAAAVTELEVSFSVDMLDPIGDTDMIDVSNPANYRLVSTNDPQEVLPSNCADPIGANTTDHAIVIRTYDTASKTAIIGSPFKIGLSKQRYKLMACFDGLKSVQGGQLDGNSDGSAGDDYAIDFSITATNLLKNPNFTDTINSWTTSGNVIPVSDDADNAIIAGSANIDLAATISQCVELNGATNMRFGTSLKSDLANGDSNLMVEYYDADQCTGSVLNSKQSVKNANNSAWKDVLLDSVVPPGSVSAQITVEGNATQSPILMDRSYFIKTSNNIFSNGFEENSQTVCVQSNNGAGME